MVLKISLYQLGRFRELGIPVAITRDSDVYIESYARSQIVKNSGAKYCISNHINAGGGDGAEVIKSIYDNSNIAESLAASLESVGQNIRRVFTRHLPNNKRADYYFMHRLTGHVSTFIIEYGFADSKVDDIEQLNNDWKKYAEAIVKFWTEFLGYKYIPKDEPCQKETDSSTVNNLAKEFKGRNLSVMTLLDTIKKML